MASSATQGHMLTYALNPSSQTTLNPALQQRACDRCRRRKTRCDGLEPCKSCSRVGVECLYALPQKPRGRKPKGKSHKLDESRATFVDIESIDTDACDLQTSSPLRLETQPDLLSASDAVCLAAEPSILDRSIMWTTPASAQVKWSKGHQQRLTTFPSFTFAPYIELFFDRFYPIFPVLELDKLRNIATGPATREAGWQLPPQSYALLTSLSAAVILQLNLHNQTCLDDAFQTLNHQTGQLSTSDRTNLTFISAENFITHCLHARQQWDFMATPDEESIMTSFFLFEYYGNKNQSEKAWYYLRESIGFSLAQRMDQEDLYRSLPVVDAQRKSRMFWLLYITERAYALQHRSSVILRPSIPLPRVFDSPDPKLVYGFVNLVNLYRRVDTQFLSAWKAKPAFARAIEEVPETLVGNKSLDDLGHFGNMSLSATNAEILEIQYLDIRVTQAWLPLLEWQLKNSKRLTSTTVAYPMSTNSRPSSFRPLFPFKVSQELLSVISSASRRSLESHGIGMEQKIFDVACCLSDVLESAPLTRESSVTGHTFLHGFMTLLASFRNQESQYLQPLLDRAAKTLAAELQSPRLLTAPVQDRNEATEDWIPPDI